MNPILQLLYAVILNTYGRNGFRISYIVKLVPDTQIWLDWFQIFKYGETGSRYLIMVWLVPVAGGDCLETEWFQT